LKVSSPSLSVLYLLTGMWCALWWASHSDGDRSAYLSTSTRTPLPRKKPDWAGLYVPDATDHTLRMAAVLLHTMIKLPKKRRFDPSSLSLLFLLLLPPSRAPDTFPAPSVSAKTRVLVIVIVIVPRASSRSSRGCSCNQQQQLATSNHLESKSAWVLWVVTFVCYRYF
jgi:hypothetical protein